MGVLSEADVRRIAEFGRNAAKAPAEDAVMAEALETLREVAGVEELRVVYSPHLPHWKEWKANPKGVEVRTHDERPSPAARGLTVLFDADNEPQSGFMSVDNKREKTRATAQLMAPGIWASLLLHAALERAQRSSISEAEFVRQMLRARDEERRRIARELHDDFGQTMASLKLSLKYTEGLVRDSSSPEAALTELATARESIATMMNKLRDLSHTLYPRILDTLGVVSAIRELLHQTGKHSGIEANVTIRGKERPLEKDIAVGVYRCCQEAVSNVIRHANATRLAVQIRYGEKEVRVSVEDNGKGFDPRKLYDTGTKIMSSGFWTIRQRMADLGGAFRLSTANGQGTVIEMVVPYTSRQVHGKRKNNAANRG